MSEELLKLQLKNGDLIENACDQWVIAMSASGFDIDAAGKAFSYSMRRFIEDHEISNCK